MILIVNQTGKKEIKLLCDFLTVTTLIGVISIGSGHSSFVSGTYDGIIVVFKGEKSCWLKTDSKSIIESNDECCYIFCNKLEEIVLTQENNNVKIRTNNNVTGCFSSIVSKKDFWECYRYASLYKK